MLIKIDKAKALSNKILQQLGFSKSDSQLITQNLISAELANRKSHGLVRIPAIKRNIDKGKINTTHDGITFVKKTDNSLLVNAKHKPAFIAIYESLDKAIKIAQKNNVVVVGVQDAAYCSGYIGDYARIATENDFIFIGFNNSPGGLIPYGAKKELWGTNPITVGVPTNGIPVILDMASSKVTWGSLVVARQEGKEIPKGVALNKDGMATTKPQEVIDKGGVLPIFGHKGSGLAFIVEILAGALTGSRVGHTVKGGWGTSYILINPAMFRPLRQFKDDIETAIKELKQAPKADGVKEIYFPGEQSFKTIEKNLKAGQFEISQNLMEELKGLLCN